MLQGGSDSLIGQEEKTSFFHFRKWKRSHQEQKHKIRSGTWIIEPIRRAELPAIFKMKKGIRTCGEQHQVRMNLAHSVYHSSQWLVKYPPLPPFYSTDPNFYLEIND